MRFIRIFLAITWLTTFCDVSVASIPDRDKSVDWQKASILPDTSTSLQKYFVKYMPYQLTPTQNSSALTEEIQKKISQKMSDDFLGGEFFKKTAAGRALDKVEKATNQSFTIGNPEKKEIVHIFKFHFKALERNAEINYSGFFDSRVLYNMDTSVAALSVSKPLDEETSLSLVNSTNIYQVQFNPTITLTHFF